MKRSESEPIVNTTKRINTPVSRKRSIKGKSWGKIARRGRRLVNKIVSKQSNGIRKALNRLLSIFESVNWRRLISWSMLIWTTVLCGTLTGIAHRPMLPTYIIAYVVSELPQIVFASQAFGVLQTWGTGILGTTAGKIMLLLNATSALFLFEGLVRGMRYVSQFRSALRNAEMLPSTWHTLQRTSKLSAHPLIRIRRWLSSGYDTIWTIIRLFLPFPSLIGRGVKVVRDIRYTEADSQPQDASAPLQWDQPQTMLYSILRKIQPLMQPLRGAGFSDGMQHLDIYYKPDNIDEHNKLPVLLYIHGGGWSTLDKKVVMVPMLRSLADSDRVVVVSANYRLAPETVWPGQFIDVKRALVWVRKNVHTYGGDPEHIVVGGESAGGHLASLLALTQNRSIYQPGFEDEDTRVSGCVDISSPHNLVCRKTFLTRGMSEYAERFLLQKEFAKNRQRFEEASPYCVLNDIPAIAFSPPCRKCRAQAPLAGFVTGLDPFTQPISSSRKNRVSTTRRRQRTLRTIKLSTDLEDTNNSLFNFYSRHSAPVAPRKPRLMTREPVSATTLALANRKRRTSEYTPTNAFEDFPAIPPFLGFCTRKDVMIPVEDMQGFYERLKSRREDAFPQSCAACRCGLVMVDLQTWLNRSNADWNIIDIVIIIDKYLHSGIRARRPKDVLIDVPDGYHSFGYFVSPRAEGLATTVLAFIRYTVHYKSLLNEKNQTTEDTQVRTIGSKL